MNRISCDDALWPAETSRIFPDNVEGEVFAVERQVREVVGKGAQILAAPEMEIEIIATTIVQKNSIGDMGFLTLRASRGIAQAIRYELSRWKE